MTARLHTEHCLIRIYERILTLQEVELTGGGVETHKVEATGGPASASLSCWLPRGQTLQHTALSSPVQTENQDLALSTLLLLLRAGCRDVKSPEIFGNAESGQRLNTSFIQHGVTVFELSSIKPFLSKYLIVKMQCCT